MIRAPLLPNPVMYCVVSGCERTATSTCRASSAVRNSSLVIATRSTALYGMPACLSARSSTPPCAGPWENPSFLPRNWLTDVTSDPGAVANWYIGLLEVDTATIFACTPLECAWIGGMPALLAMSTECARKPSMTSGPAVRLGQLETLNGSLLSCPDACSSSSVVMIEIASEVLGLTVVGSVEVRLSTPLLGASAAHAASPSAPTPAIGARKARRPTAGGTAC